MGLLQPAALPVLPLGPHLAEQELLQRQARAGGVGAEGPLRHGLKLLPHLRLDEDIALFVAEQGGGDARQQDRGEEEDGQLVFLPLTEEPAYQCADHPDKTQQE